MAQNFGSNFLRGFQPNFANMFDNSYKAAAILDERERQRQEEEKARQQQLGILSQLFKGTKNVPMFQNNRAPLMNAGQSFTNNEVPLSSQEQFDLRAQLSPSSALSFLDSQNKPKQKETVKVGNQLFLENPLIKGMPMGDALFTEPKATTTEDFVKATDVKGLENFKDHLVNRTITQNPDGTETIKYGQPFTWKRQSININTGEEYNKLDPKTQGTLDGYVGEIRGLQGLLSHPPDAGTQDKPAYTIYDKMGQPAGEMTPEEVKAAIINKQAELGNLLDTNGGEAIVDYKRYKEKTGGVEPKLWDTIYQNYIRDANDDKDDAWFMTQKYKFFQDYGYDPIMKFHQGLIKQKK